MPDGHSVSRPMSGVTALRVRSFLAAAADLDPSTLKRLTADQIEDVARAVSVLRGDIVGESAIRRLRDARAGGVV